MMYRICVIAGLSSLLALSAAAQENHPYELGIKGGAGLLGHRDDAVPARPSFGVEACFSCQNRVAWFADYSHLFDSRGGSAYRSAEFLAAGLRIQFRQRVRPYVDVGLALGHSRFGPGGDPDTFTGAGLALGVGVRIPIGSRLYVRPQYRLAFLKDSFAAALGEVGVGWRF
jgi:hypothetical protein